MWSIYSTPQSLGDKKQQETDASLLFGWQPHNSDKHCSLHVFSSIFSRSNSEENKKTVGNAQANLYFVAFCPAMHVIFRPCIQHMLGKDLFLFCVMSSLESQRNCEFKVESNMSGASLTRIRMDWTLAGKLFDIRQLI